MIQFKLSAHFLGQCSQHGKVQLSGGSNTGIGQQRYSRNHLKVTSFRLLRELSLHAGGPGCAAHGSPHFPPASRTRVPLICRLHLLYIPRESLTNCYLTASLSPCALSPSLEIARRALLCSFKR